MESQQCRHWFFGGSFVETPKFPIRWDGVRAEFVVRQPGARPEVEPIMSPAHADHSPHHIHSYFLYDLFPATFTHGLWGATTTVLISTIKSSPILCLDQLHTKLLRFSSYATMPPAKSKVNHDDSKPETANAKERNNHGSKENNHTNGGTKLRRVASSAGSNLREVTTVNGHSNIATPATVTQPNPPPGV